MMFLTTRWVGRIFLRPGRLLYVGAIGPTDPHAHHAFQIARGLSGPIAFVGGLGERFDAAAAVVPPDTLQATAGATASGWMMYVDPDDLVGRRLRCTAGAGSSPGEWAEAARPLREMARLLPEDWDEVDALEVAVFAAFGVPKAVPRSRHPAVGRAVPALSASSGSPISTSMNRSLGSRSSGSSSAPTWKSDR